MDSAKSQLVDRLKSANNVLVTVSRDPSVDQLSALLGLTLLLNKLDKHAAAVFSGQVPSTIEFLQPESTIEKTTDSLRDFIIALDKSKADKLRYKVEDDVVRIFITPYKTSISQDDLEFSQGDFNVDVVVALGVHRQEDLDEAITAHGRILHDATVASINVTPDGGLGSINWQDPQASSLSELVTELGQALDPQVLDNQIATALLTGIVAETERFSNEKTTSHTMSASAALMAAGADQQLVATKLEEPSSPLAAGNEGVSDGGKSKTSDDQPPKPNDGTLEIEHDNDAAPEPPEEEDKKAAPPPADVPATLPEPEISNVHIVPESAPPPAAPVESAGSVSDGPKLVTEPPELGGTLTANTQPEGLDPPTDPMSLPDAEPPQLLSRSDEPAGTPANPPAPSSVPAPAQPPASPLSPAPADGQSGETLSDIEVSVHSPHLDAANVDEARDEVTKALNESAPPAPEPIAALNAQPLGDELHPSSNPLGLSSEPTPPAQPPASPLSPTPAPSDTPQIIDSNAPPPVPPPIPFSFGNPGAPPS